MKNGQLLDSSWGGTPKDQNKVLATERLFGVDQAKHSMLSVSSVPVRGKNQTSLLS